MHLPKQNAINVRRLLHTETISTYEIILLSYSQGNEIATVTLNRPKKKNAYSKAMYTELDKTLRSLSDDKKLKVILLTGAGDYFSSGNDLSNFSQIMHPLTIASESREICYSFVDSFISCRKPIVVAVNGPCFGIAVTTLGLCDTRFSSDTASFKTPFAELGQAPEGCSSYMFPLIMGEGMANEVLAKGKSLNAIEALECNLIHYIHSQETVRSEALKYCEHLCSLPIGSDQLIRRIVRDNLVEVLKKVNKDECDECEKKWVCKESFHAIALYLESRNMRAAGMILRVANMLGPLWGQPK